MFIIVQLSIMKKKSTKGTAKEGLKKKNKTIHPGTMKPVKRIRDTG